VSDTFGTNYQVTVFGESHGTAIGCVIGGLPAGFRIDFNLVRRDLERRAPGRDDTSTSRRESDEFEVLSGIFNDLTTGAPLTAVCRNADTRSRDYTPELPRPGHADLAAAAKYGGFADYRGGGHFSGRLTAPIVFAGSIAKQILRARHGIGIAARIASIHGETDADAQRETILAAKARGDSVGGVIECAASDVPMGWGEPMFRPIETEIAAIMFAIPAVKGVEFGDGFAFTARYGSEVSDGYGLDANGNLVALANHNGGINGGIANGEPVVFRAAIKPTPTISASQKTVNLQMREAVTHSFTGRHDPCIVPRAVPVIECATAIALMQYYII
jgi:chorismate synthase